MCGDLREVDWNERYGVNTEEWFFGKEPSELGGLTMRFWRIMHACQEGDLLDLGCGEGRDSVYFAKQGFRVTALDAALNGIEKTKRLARESNTEIETLLHQDVAEYVFHHSFNIVFSGNCLQVLGDGYEPSIRDIQANTTLGGFNSIRSLRKGSEVMSNRTDLHQLETNELKSLYDGWRLLYYCEDIIYVPHMEGHITFAEIIAQRMG